MRTLLAFLPSLIFLSAQADVKMPVIFGDHMVLQENAKLPIWGWAAAGELVKVSFADQMGSAVTASDGTWRVDLPAVAPSDQGQVLTIAGENTITFQDVLVGDVWVASGQSNMEFGISRDALGGPTVLQADDPKLRLFYVSHDISLDPKTDLAPNSGKWMICTPQNLGGGYGWDGKGFSAVAYYFAQEIRKTTGHPIGMIDSCWGGTPAQAWTSISGMEKAPELTHYVDDHKKTADAYNGAQATYPQQMSDYKDALQKWTDEVDTPFKKATEDWKQDAQNAKDLGQPIPAQPVLSQPMPQPPGTPSFGDANSPANLFNGMIAPLIPFAIKGVIWYQGESNSFNVPLGQEYAVLFPRLIQDWREKWGQGNFPFLFVQLANYTYPGWSFPMVREAQLKTLALPATGMAVTIDIGNPTDIHPADKTDVGHRLVLAARHVAYGEDLVYSGPIYDTMTPEGDRVSLSFKNIGGGLITSAPPWTPSGQPVQPPTELTGFQIAGDDKQFVPAKAEIEGNTVIVSSDKVTQPTAVRYAWDNNPVPAGNLYNKERLPASPFRTDGWNP